MHIESTAVQCNSGTSLLKTISSDCGYVHSKAVFLTLHKWGGMSIWFSASGPLPLWIPPVHVVLCSFDRLGHHQKRHRGRRYVW